MALEGRELVEVAGVAPGHRVAELEEGLRHLRAGGVIAAPTDTLYGLAADVGNEGALERVFDIKGRPAELALPVLVASWEQVEMVAKVENGSVRRLAEAFWPGSLTLVLPKAGDLSALVTGGRETVAVRMPGHWAPLHLAAGLRRPITGTSANRSGQADLKSVEELRETLGEAVDTIVAVGPEPQGLQSTIVDMTGDAPVLLREGATDFGEVMRVWGTSTGSG